MEVPPEDITKYGLENPKLENPKLVLDNGDIVWGCECWWGSEKAVEASIARYSKIVLVDIKTCRAARE